ncbi:unnamed protein product [Eruca vesicaria subsp. sativa]|uniref:Uncharacterized protein n=1 Tax=Eruca vesicaria subsp. sativa TaxID=29727 RepID=A0ABC8JCD8_ERUVS|nr:unnamed protein product [Eruca vesicaria subsp. sativa]
MSLIVKTGTGPFGSPISTSMLMSAEFNLLGKGSNNTPTFMLHFKPRFGDFSIKKSHSSSGFDGALLRSVNGSEEDSLIEVVESPGMRTSCRRPPPEISPGCCLVLRSRRGRRCRDNQTRERSGKVSGLRTNGDVCLVLEELRSENKELKRAVEDLRGVMVSNVRTFYREAERSSDKSSNGRGRGDRWSSE